MAVPRDDLGEGVVYANRDQAGFAIRMLILLVDGFVILLAALALGVSTYVIFPGPAARSIYTLGMFAFLVVYCVFVESTSFGTVGFLVTGVKIVDLRGKKPSYFRMACRLGLWLFLPLNPVIIFFWILNDRRKQPLHDKLAGTYLVKKRATPIGRGRIHAELYFFLGMAWLFPEVERSGDMSCDPKFADAVVAGRVL